MTEFLIAFAAVILIILKSLKCGNYLTFIYL